MHRALQIDEIVGIICAQTARAGPSDWWAGLPTQQYPSRCGDLARLARTCTAFLDPALDALWGFQGTLLHLLRAMPSDLWEIIEIPWEEDEDAANDSGSREENMRLTISLRRTVRPSDWDRFTFYARRVRSFKDGHVHDETSVVYDILTSQFPNGTVFPRIEILDWFPIALELFHHIHLFLSHGITGLHISLDNTADSAIFDLLTTQFPGLKNVGIGGTVAERPFSRFICSLKELETLVAPKLDSTAFNHISRLPRLRYLWLMSKTPPRLPPRPKDLPCFPALAEFRCESIEAAPNLLERTGRSLVEFSLPARSWASPPTKQIFQELYAALASSCTHTLLEKIHVDKPSRALPINAAQLDLYILSGDDLRKLFCFRNLVHVSLAHSVAVDLDDVVAIDMARAWPRIEVLWFPCDTTYRIASRMTLEGVYAFAEHCPLLEDLSVLFDATTVPKSTGTLGGKTQPRVSQDKLAFLDVGYSMIGTKKKDWRRVADFLRSIFPELYEVRATKPGSSVDPYVLKEYKAWMKVSDDLA
ncbi:hypothetical protein FB45DRAFT_801320 [Roridomyces roridus]|uniref:F-box domain-containing protein n=1 Tax=Roridomyces roridus TaxID=1738132 RepID=A0AAD7BC32_9AGAR|nr:hypothetical protein FB45DRAFT_801320 [Roridomyces roridus]